MQVHLENLLKRRDKMKMICAWCSKRLRPGRDGVISHGICETCMKRELIKYRKSKGEGRAIKEKPIVALKKV